MPAWIPWLLICLWIPGALVGLASGAEPSPAAGPVADDPLGVAERLLRSAQQNELSETQAAEAARWGYVGDGQGGRAWAR